MPCAIRPIPSSWIHGKRVNQTKR